MQAGRTAVALALLLAGCLGTPLDRLPPGPLGAPGPALVVSTNPLASEAGASLLVRGGNAFDAAVAVQWALQATEPSNSGLGGSTTALLYLAAERRVVYLDGLSAAPAGTSDEQLSDLRPPEHDDTTRGFAAAVPGTPALMWELHQRYGALPWSATFEPALALAEGHALGTFTATTLGLNQEKLRSWPESAAIWFPGALCPPRLPSGSDDAGCAGGRALRAGDRFEQPDLAGTFRLLAESGIEPFYRGPIAEAVVEAAARREGRMTVEDLGAYRVREREPFRTTYAGHEVVAAGAPAGGLEVTQTLALLDPFRLRDLEPGGADERHLLLEAFQLAVTDRWTYVADPDFADVPLRGLLHPDYVAERRALIDPQRAAREFQPGDPWRHEGRAGEEPAPSRTRGGTHTTHFLVVDAAGNVAAVTSTVNAAFGTGITVPGFGFVLNNHGLNFDGDGNGTWERAPNKHVPSSTTPTLVLRDGVPVLVAGAAGSQTIPNSVLHIVLGALDHGLGAQAAVDRARMYTSGVVPFPDCATDGAVGWDRDLPASVREELAARGHVVRAEGSPFGYGVAQAATRRAGGTWEGGADTRSFHQGGIAVVHADGRVEVTSPTPPPDTQTLEAGPQPLTLASCAARATGPEAGSPGAWADSASSEPQPTSRHPR